MAKADKPKPKKIPDKDQAERFKETARQLGVDETGEAFEKAFERVVPPVRPGRKSG
jgi:hypothetical protein